MGWIIWNIRVVASISSIWEDSWLEDYLSPPNNLYNSQTPTIVSSDCPLGNVRESSRFSNCKTRSALFYSPLAWSCIN